jgi:hypothetical protein
VRDFDAAILDCVPDEVLKYLANCISSALPPYFNIRIQLERIESSPIVFSMRGSGISHVTATRA